MNPFCIDSPTPYPSLSPLYTHDTGHCCQDALPHITCKIVGGKQQLAALCQGHYPGTVVGRDSGRATEELSAPRKREEVSQCTETSSSSPPKVREGEAGRTAEEQSHRAQAVQWGASHMGRSAPSASTALEKWVEVTATGADVEKSQKEHWGPADKRDEGHPKKTGG